MPTLLAAAFLVGTFLDTTVFRPISLSDEGWLFDAFFRLGFGLVLTLFALSLARLHSAWHELVATLDGFAKILGQAFERNPRHIAHWLTDSRSCEAEYGYLIRRQIGAVRGLLAGWDDTVEPPKTAVLANLDETKKQLSILFEQSENASRQQAELSALKYFARALAAVWASAPVGHAARAGKEREHEEKTEPTREQKIVEYLEDLLALEAARWVGGAWHTSGFPSAF